MLQFAASKQHVQQHLVFVFEEFARLIDLRHHIVIARFGPHANFFQRIGGAPESRPVRSLAILVQESCVLKDAVRCSRKETNGLSTARVVTRLPPTTYSGRILRSGRLAIAFKTNIASLPKPN